MSHPWNLGILTIWPTHSWCWSWTGTESRLFHPRCLNCPNYNTCKSSVLLDAVPPPPNPGVCVLIHIVAKGILEQAYGHPSSESWGCRIWIGVILSHYLVPAASWQDSKILTERGNSIIIEQSPYKGAIAAPEKSWGSQQLWFMRIMLTTPGGLDSLRGCKELSC